MNKFSQFITLAILLYLSVDAHQHYKKRGEVWLPRALLGVIILGAVAMGSLISAATFGYAAGAPRPVVTEGLTDEAGTGELTFCSAVPYTDAEKQAMEAAGQMWCEESITFGATTGTSTVTIDGGAVSSGSIEPNDYVEALTFIDSRNQEGLSPGARAALEEASRYLGCRGYQQASGMGGNC